MRSSISDKEQSKTGNKVEFKVTPYTIVNLTTRLITVKRNKSSQDDNQNSYIPKEYVIIPGDSVDYEVDYEEESRQLMRTSRDEFIKKHDYISIIIDGEDGQRVKVSDFNLRTVKTYKKYFDKKCNDYVIYGVTLENMRKILTFRAPYTITNMTEFDYKIKFFNKQ